MYKSFYGLKEKPFELLPDPAFLYMSKGHRAALTLLRYSIVSRQAFSVVTGEVGSGKTTLINQILDEMDADTTVGLMSFTHQDSGDMAEWVMMAFGIDYRNQSKAERYDRFVSFLIGEYAQGRQTILIVDEAQNMQVEGLENVRMLSNVNAQKEYLLHLILVGQPELRELLKREDMRQLTQRVSAAYHLKSLSAAESEEYIRYRLEVAGATAEIFSPNARRLIANASEGIPRVINTICDMALVYGFSDQQKLITSEIVKSVLKDRADMGLISDVQATGADVAGA
jgi:type II secretory pathway predicted ATPase ExeA